jgi:putative inorganic carbon (hco3(-)) transporter
MRASFRSDHRAKRPEPARRPSVPALLMLYVALLPVQFNIREGLNFAPSDAVLLAYLLFQSNRIRFRRAAWSVWHAAFLPMMVLSAWVGLMQNGDLTQYVVFNKLIGALWLLIAYAAFSAEISTTAEIRSVARTFVASVSALNVVAITGFYWLPLESLFPRLNYYEGERLAGFLIDPNAYGGLLLTALTLQAVTGLWRAPLFRGLAGALIYLSLAVGLVLTFSRSAWIGLAVALIFLGAMRPLQTLKLAIVTAGSGLALLLSLAYKGSDYFHAMVIRPQTIQSRLESEGAALEGFLFHPVLGTGLGTFLNEHGIIIHNTLLWILSECGVVGAFVVVGLAMWYFRVAIPAIRSSRGAGQGLIVALAAAHAGMLGVSVGIEALYQRHWWLVMAMIAAYRPGRSRARIFKVWHECGFGPQSARFGEVLRRGRAHPASWAIGLSQSREQGAARMAREPSKTPGNGT